MSNNEIYLGKKLTPSEEYDLLTWINSLQDEERQFLLLRLMRQRSHSVYGTPSAATRDKLTQYEKSNASLKDRLSAANRRIGDLENEIEILAKHINKPR